ncbi:MAG: DNA/RNA non-specific endonuclease [Bacteroidota bacterium]
MKLRSMALAATFLLLFNRCDEEKFLERPIIEDLTILGGIDASIEIRDGTDFSNESARTSSFNETFENRSKSSYAGATVSLNTGSYYMSDALIGTSSSDRKFGSSSSRVRNSGYIIMQFDMDNGASTVRVSHARFGNDGSSSWRLIASYNGGNSWYYVGSTITTNSSSFQNITYNVNESSRVRYGLYKTSGGSNRINYDNFEITTSGGGGSSATRDSNLTFGNPSNASTSQSNNYLVSRNEYAYSYNNSRGRINWVSWHLSTAWLGSASRQNDFRTDTTLPSSFYRASSSSYSGSGFDRGHICPSADRTYSTSANSITFYMSNMGPQAPNNNRQTWRLFEEYLREVVRDGNEIHLIAGVIGQGGDGSNGSASTIASGSIDVPSSFWKVALILPNGSNDVSRVTSSTRVIAVNMPNTQSINTTNWGIYRTSVNQIENLAGVDLFENISNNIESIIESRVDNGPT